MLYYGESGWQVCVTANYMGANITVFPRLADGKLGEGHVISFQGKGADKERQEQPHLHCVVFHSRRKVAFGKRFRFRPYSRFSGKTNFRNERNGFNWMKRLLLILSWLQVQVRVIRVLTSRENMRIC